MSLIEAAQIAERCQRNWTYDPIPEEHIDEIIKVCTHMPTKQNKEVYELFVSTNLDLNHKIFKNAIDADNPDTTLRNAQVDAPLLLIWARSAVSPELENDLNVAVGISSGGAALAAANLGYKTGFCKCYPNKTIKNLLTSHGANLHNKNDIFLMLGIGKEDPNFDRGDVVVDGEKVRSIKKIGSKEIKTHRLS